MERFRELRSRYQVPYKTAAHMQRHMLECVAETLLLAKLSVRNI